ncbi:MAG: hypothetical protein OEZ13_03565 [Spirochaetia bacterium]|nr:hypothetical protein [Spirochaetia bacterium]
MIKKLSLTLAGISFVLILLSAFNIFYPERLLSHEVRSFDLAYHNFFLNSSAQKSEKISGWKTNRRFYYLARFFSEIGVQRCEPYLPDKNCESVENSYKLIKKQEAYAQENNARNKKAKPLKNKLLKNMHIQIGNENPQIIWFFFYAPDNLTNKKSLALFLELSHFFKKNCKKERPALWLFLEGEPGLSHFLKENASILELNEFTLNDLIKNGFLVLSKQDSKWMYENIFLEKETGLEEVEYLNSNIENYYKYFCES